MSTPTGTTTAGYGVALAIVVHIVGDICSYAVQTYNNDRGQMAASLSGWVGFTILQLPTVACGRCHEGYVRAPVAESRCSLFPCGRLSPFWWWSKLVLATFSEKSICTCSSSSPRDVSVFMKYDVRAGCDRGLIAPIHAAGHHHVGNSEIT